MKSTLSILGIVSIMIFLILPQLPASAGETDLIATLSVRGEYDDNIDFSNQDAIDDYAADVVPRLEFKKVSELLNFNAVAELDILRYLSETHFDRINQLYNINGQYQVASRWKILGSFQFIADETTDSQLVETGRVFKRERRKRFDGSVGTRYQLTELSNLGPNFYYNKTNFGGDNEDYDIYAGSFSYGHLFKTQRDELTLDSGYSKYDSDITEADNYSATAAWKHLLSETVTGRLSLGARYTESKDKTENNQDSNWGGLADVSISKTGETLSVDFGFSRDLNLDTQGQLIEVNRFYGAFDKRIFERFGLRFNGSWYYSSQEFEGGGNENVIYFDLVPSLYYLLTEKHTLVLAYSYQQQREISLPGNPVAERNKIWLGINLQFPFKWD